MDPSRLDASLAERVAHAGHHARRSAQIAVPSGQVGNSLYSAPYLLVGKRLWLRATDGAVALYEDYRHVHTHPKARRLGERITVRDHLPPDAARFLEHDRQWYLEQAQAIGAACAALVGHLLADRILEKLRAAQGVLRLPLLIINRRLRPEAAATAR